MLRRKLSPLPGLLSRLAGRPRMPEPTYEEIARSELTALLRRGCIDQTVTRIEFSPGHIVQLTELLRERDLELPATVVLSKLSGQGKDISGAVRLLTIRLAHRDANISAYSANALTHHYLRMCGLHELDMLFSADLHPVRKGCAEALMQASLKGDILAADFLAIRLSSEDHDLRKSAFWALRNSAESGPDEVRQAIAKASSKIIEELKETGEAVDLDIYRMCSRLVSLASD